jgi:acyl carrier protein
MLMIELETEFNITFSEADLNPYDLKTVNDVIQLIQKYKEENDV